MTECTILNYQKYRIKTLTSISIIILIVTRCKKKIKNATGMKIDAIKSHMFYYYNYYAKSYDN